MKLTGTLGVRASLQPRYVAERSEVCIDTEWGPVQVKCGAGRIRPEHEDIARIAMVSDMDYPEVLKQISDEARRQLRLN
jgi:uncharacterized protein (DUF111 family)